MKRLGRCHEEAPDSGNSIAGLESGLEEEAVEGDTIATHGIDGPATGGPESPGCGVVGSASKMCWTGAWEPMRNECSQAGGR